MEALDNSLDLHNPIHSLSFTLMSRCLPEVAENTFKCPHIVFLVLANIRQDSSLNTAEIMSKSISKFIWGMRATAVHQALMHRNIHRTTLLGYALFFLLAFVK